MPAVHIGHSQHRQRLVDTQEHRKLDMFTSCGMDSEQVSPVTQKPVPDGRNVCKACNAVKPGISSIAMKGGAACCQSGARRIACLYNAAARLVLWGMPTPWACIHPRLYMPSMLPALAATPYSLPASSTPQNRLVHADANMARHPLDLCTASLLLQQSVDARQYCRKGQNQSNVGQLLHSLLQAVIARTRQTSAASPAAVPGVPGLQCCRQC